MSLTLEETNEMMRRANFLWKQLSINEKVMYNAEATRKGYITKKRFFYHYLIDNLLTNGLEESEARYPVGLMKNMKVTKIEKVLGLRYIYVKYNIIRDDGREIFLGELDKSKFEAEAYDMNMNPHPDVVDIFFNGEWIELELTSTFTHFKGFIKCYYLNRFEPGKNFLIYAEAPVLHLDIAPPEEMPIFWF